jgi:hypothetical protein
MSSTAAACNLNLSTRFHALNWLDLTPSADMLHLRHWQRLRGELLYE